MCPSTRTLAPATDPASHLRPAFEVLDADRDGKISYNDLSRFYTGFLGGGPAEANQDMVGTMISVADLDRNGFVEYDEFERVLTSAQGTAGRAAGERVLEDVFRIMDKDGDGKLSRGDLRGYMEWAGLEATDEDIEAMIGLGGGGNMDCVTFDGLLKILAADNILP